MKKITQRAYFLNYCKEQLFPSLGKAWGTYLLANIIVSEINSLPTSENLSNKLADFISGGIGGWHIWAIYGTGLLFIVSSLVRLYSKWRGPSEFWLKFYARRNIIFWLLQFSINTAIAPLTVIATVLIGSNSTLIWISWILIPLVYIIASYGIYFLEHNDRNEASSGIYFNINTPPNASAQEADKLVDKFRLAFKSINQLGEPKLTTNTTDGLIVIELPIIFPINIWDDAARESFLKAYDKRKQIVNQNGFKLVSTNPSPSVRKFIEEPKVFQKKNRFKF